MRMKGITSNKNKGVDPFVLSESIKDLQQKIMTPESEEEVSLWEDRIEAIFQLKEVGEQMEKLEEKKKAPLKRLYAECRNQIFGLKAGIQITDLLRSQDPALDRTRIMHLLEVEIEDIRDFTQIAHVVQLAHEKTEHFVMRAKETGIVDKVTQLQTMKQYQQEQINAVSKELEGACDKEEVKEEIGRLQNRLKHTEEQLDEIYSTFEEGYFKAYEEATKELKALSKEEIEIFLDYIDKKESKKKADRVAIEEIGAFLRNRQEKVNIDFLRVTNNLLKGFLRKEIEKALSI